MDNVEKLLNLIDLHSETAAKSNDHRMAYMIEALKQIRQAALNVQKGLIISDQDIETELRKNSHSPWSAALWLREQLTGK